jgi:hypothetical protein
MRLAVRKGPSLNVRQFAAFEDGLDVAIARQDPAVMFCGQRQDHAVDGRSRSLAAAPQRGVNAGGDGACPGRLESDAGMVRKGRS